MGPAVEVKFGPLGSSWICATSSVFRAVNTSPPPKVVKLLTIILSDKPICVNIPAPLHFAKEMQDVQDKDRSWRGSPSISVYSSASYDLVEIRCDERLSFA